MQETQDNNVDLAQLHAGMPQVKQAATPLVAGIVAEYNPFHKGHAWMIDMLREGGVETIVCVMSGSFVQRAGPAVMPTHVRAKAAIAGGADLVLRLPVPWAVASAEGFAQGAAGLLAALGCVDILAFGAEDDNIEQLIGVAELLLIEDFNSLVRVYLSNGQSYPAARAAAQAACRVLLVDEFQDLTPAHLLLVRLLSGGGGHVFAVGDDDQTIYGYNGADPRWLIDFAD